MSVRTLVAISAVLFVLTVGTVSAEASPPWTTISRGAGTSPIHGGRSTAGVLIGSRRRLDAFPDLLEPGAGRCCGWYATFDWQQRAVLLVVAKVPHEFEIARLTRRRSVLRVTIVPRYPGQPDFAAPLTSWEAVSVPRSLLGHPLPRRMIVAAS